MTKIKACNGCKPHPYQDKKYGPGQRVHNTGAKADKCTVCGKANPK